MRLSSIALALAISLLFTLRAFAEPAFLRPGTVLDEDIDVKRLSGTWFAIHLNGGKWYLSKTTVAVAKDKNGTLNIRGKHPKTIGLLRGTELTEGPVESASLIVNANGNSNSFRFKGRHYKLVVQPVPFKYHSEALNKTFDNVRNDVYFSNGTDRTLVYGDSESGRSCDHPFVLWAGDIDRDGKPDIIADFDDDSQKNASVCAFLSSSAKKGRLIKNAGCQVFSG